jgi:RNA polymerase sigma-70 factor, ECF subfamily
VEQAANDGFDLSPFDPAGSTPGSTPVTVTADHFERLTLPYLGDVSRFARSLTREAATADDLVQETYLQALRGWHTFRPDADPKRWLFAICHHAFLRTVRHDARYVEAPESDPELESMATARAHYTAQMTGAAAALERMDLGPAIAKALDALQSHYRVAVVLVDVEGQSYEQAAEVLGLATGTVRSRLFRGRRLLQDLLFEFAQDAGFASTRGSTTSTDTAQDRA